MEAIGKYPETDWQQIFTDGSKLQEGQSGLGFHFKNSHLEGSEAVGKTMPFVEAELKAIHRTLSILKPYPVEAGMW